MLSERLRFKQKLKMELAWYTQNRDSELGSGSHSNLGKHKPGDTVGPCNKQSLDHPVWDKNTLINSSKNFKPLKQE